jgi:hypothetical protein
MSTRQLEDVAEDVVRKAAADRMPADAGLVARAREAVRQAAQEARAESGDGHWADLRAWLENEQAVMERWADERVPGSAGQHDRVARSEMAGDVLGKMTELEAGQ